MRIIFMGTPAFSVPALEALVQARHEVVAVYSQPPRKAGRGQKVIPSPVHQRAEALGIPVLTPKSLKPDEAAEAMATFRADVAVVVAYGLILPQRILDTPRLGCLNIHASLLPRWRGAAPIQRAILAGDKETGVCIMQMEAGLDTGPVLLYQTVPITDDTTATILHDTLSALGAEMIVPALQALADGTVQPISQPEDGVTYAHKLDKAEGQLDWTETAHVLHRKVRAFTPWPGTFFKYGGEVIRVHAVDIADIPHNAEPGTVLDEHFTIACADGTALRLLTLQRAGRKAMTAEDFLRGFPIMPGEYLAGSI